MKKILALLLTFAMLFSLAACGGDEPAAKDQTPTTAPAEAPVEARILLETMVIN